MTFVTCGARIDPLFTMSDSTHSSLACRPGNECENGFSADEILRALIDPTGGARRDRTDDLLLAKQALSQLSYGPVSNQSSEVGDQKNGFWPTDY